MAFERVSELTLDEFVARYAGDEPGRYLIELGSISQNLVKALDGDLLRADCMLATNFWRAWLAADRSEAELRNAGASSVGMEQRTAIIVPRLELRRFDLVVLDPGLPPETTPNRLDLAQSMDPSALQFGAARAALGGALPYLWGDAPKAAIETSNHPFSVVIAPLPRMERLYVSSHPLDVVDTATGQRSTAGVVVEDLTKAGRVGVTAALHGIAGAAATVTVDGKTATVIRTHAVTDSAFIETAPPTYSAVAAKGVMSGLAPRGNQTADFVGTTSKKRSTTIVGWDPQVPTPSAHRQACIYTGRDAQPGDSGCALVTDDDWIVGFAFERTVPGHSPVQCSWIWAESVMNGLQVKLI